jgi:acetamidase/formamidase
MSRHPPALRVQPGDTVVMQTLDAPESMARERSEEICPILRVVLSGWREQRPATCSK